MMTRKQVYQVFPRFLADIVIFFFGFSLINLFWNAHFFAGWQPTLMNATMAAAVLIGFRNPWLLRRIKRKPVTHGFDEGSDGEAGAGIPARPVLPPSASGAVKSPHESEQA